MSQKASIIGNVNEDDDYRGLVRIPAGNPRMGHGQGGTDKATVATPISSDILSAFEQRLRQNSIRWRGTVGR